MRGIKPPTGRLVFILLVFVAACVVFFGRLFNLQFASGDMYDPGFSNTKSVYTEIPTTRGLITDVNGVVLASNRFYSNITLDKNLIPRGSENTVACELAQFFEDGGIEYKDLLPVSKNAPYVLDADFAQSPDKQKYVRNYSKYMGIEEEELTKNDSALYDTLLYRYGLDDTEEFNDKQKRLVAGIRFTLDVNAYATTDPCVLVENASDEQIGMLSDSFHRFPGLDISTLSSRYYDIDRLASHILGRCAIIFAEEADYYTEMGYALDEIVGKEGAELAFEEYLRGINGEIEIVTDAEGDRILSKNVVKEAKPGYNVTLTLDSEMQTVAERALETIIKEQAAKGAAEVRKSGKKNVGEDANAGAVVVIDPRDFAVRAAASYPTYSLNTFSEDFEAMKEDSSSPITNRAMQGRYEPGSTFKIATAAAALEYEVTTFDEYILDKGEYDFHETYKPKCWIYLDRGYTHGQQNLVAAIKNSCNYYFFEMGKRLGIDKLNSYAKKLGLGVKTGIEIGENEGVLMSPQVRSAQGYAWEPGYVLQTAIGQQHLFTPLQLASYISTVLNGGQRYRTHLFHDARDFATGEVVETYTPEILSTVDIPAETVEKLKQAMKDVVDEGTASSTFKNYKYPVGGKTGTAQVSQNSSNNVIFVGFAPFDNPEIVVAVVLEHGYSSSNAAKVAKEIFDCYFSRLYPEDFGITQINPDGSVTNPDGSVTLADGTVVETDGTKVSPDGTRTHPDGKITKPDGTVINTDGTIVYPDGTILYLDGNKKNPDGTITLPDGTVVAGDGGNTATAPGPVMGDAAEDIREVMP